MNLRGVKIFYSVFMFTLVSCSEETIDEKFIARVGDNVLTRNELNEMYESEEFANRYKSEIVRQWIEKQVLYQEASESGILETDQYKLLNELNAQQIAAALLLDEFYSENIPVINENNLRNFYEEHKDDFKLSDDLFTYNLAVFNDENAAINFRKQLMDNGWNDPALNDFGESNLLEFEKGKISNRSDITPIQLLRSLDKLLPGEVSIILFTDSDNYIIVQLIDKIEKGRIPEFEVIKKVVEMRYTVIKQRQKYNEFLQELYSKYNVEINKDYE